MSSLPLMGCGPSNGASFVGALDAYTTNLTKVWWIAKRLLSSYTGPLIRVRRSSDSLETPIGYNADGTLDTDALLAWCGSGDGFIRKIYGQLGTEGDIENATEVQPKIVSGGVLLTDGTYPASTCMSEGNTKLDIPAFSGASMSIYVRGKASSDVTFDSALVNGIGSDGSVEYMPFNDSEVYLAWGSTTRKDCGNPAPSLITSFLATCVSAPSNWRLRINGSAIFSTVTNTVGFGAAPKVHQKYGQGGSSFVGLVGYTAEHTSTEWSALEAIL